MLNMRLLREHPEVVREALAKRHETAPLDEILALDAERRQLLVEKEALQARRNQVSREIGRLLQQGQTAEAERLKAEMRAVGDHIRELEEKVRALEARLADLLLYLPNIPHPSVPVGQDERDNVLVRSWGEPRRFDFPPRPHWELAEHLDIIDFERAAKISGTRFYILKGDGARLQRALITWMLDVHRERHGYTEIYPPFLVRGQALVGSGQLPKFAENLYRDCEEDLWLIPTAEVYLVNLHRDEIIEPGRLPLYYVAWTACFRREKAAAGREVRGIKRVHQFDKVELVKIVEPERSYEELERLVQEAEYIFQQLGLPYRVYLLCTGELGFAMAKTYDINVWAPGSGEWLECSSCSNAEDFQARRANIRYRPAPGARVEFVHTLNGSGVALPRTFAALLETYQEPDGSVVIPEVLRPYMGGQERLVPPRLATRRA